MAQQANSAVKSYSGSIHLESSKDETNEEAQSSSKPKGDFFTEIESNHPPQGSLGNHASVDSFSDPEPIQPQQQTMASAVPGSTSLSTSVGEASVPVAKKVSSLGSKKPVSLIYFSIYKEIRCCILTQGSAKFNLFYGNSFS